MLPDSGHLRLLVAPCAAGQGGRLMSAPLVAPSPDTQQGTRDGPSLPTPRRGHGAKLEQGAPVSTRGRVDEGRCLLRQPRGGKRLSWWPCPAPPGKRPRTPTPSSRGSLRHPSCAEPGPPPTCEGLRGQWSRPRTASPSSGSGLPSNSPAPVHPDRWAPPPAKGSPQSTPPASPPRRPFPQVPAISLSQRDPRPRPGSPHRVAAS